MKKTAMNEFGIFRRREGRRTGVSADVGSIALPIVSSEMIRLSEPASELKKFCGDDFREKDTNKNVKHAVNSGARSPDVPGNLKRV